MMEKICIDQVTASLFVSKAARASLCHSLFGHLTCIAIDSEMHDRSQVLDRQICQRVS